MLAMASETAKQTIGSPIPVRSGTRRSMSNKKEWGDRTDTVMLQRYGR